MRNIKNFMLLCLSASLIFLGTACDDALDIDTPSQIVFGDYPANGEEAEALLFGIYGKLKSDYNNTFFHIDRSEAFEVGVIGTVSDSWSQELNAQNGPTWLNFYNTINNINFLVTESDGLSFKSEEARNRLKSQALYLRATYYFYIAKIWGDVPLILDPILSADAEPIGRTPVKDVFQQINEDIDEAIALFPDEGYKDKNFASKPAAYALKADVKMWTATVLQGGEADLDMALSAIDEVEKSGVTLLNNFKDVFDTKKNDEIIFSLFNDRDEIRNHYASTLSVRDVNYNPDVSPNIPGSSANVRHNYAPSEITRNLFDNQSDKRKDRTYLPFYLETGQDNPTSYSQTRYYGEIINEVRLFTNDFIIYRWADMLLLRAEAYLAKGKVDLAINALNQVRIRAGIDEYKGSNDQASLNIAILNERGRELFLEPKRWWDLRRFHARGTIDIYNYVPNLEGKQTPLYWPINEDVIALNNKIEQTKGY